ncbi:TPA: hypothetical protein WGP58_000599 [Neisseria meningitidis]
MPSETLPRYSDGYLPIKKQRQMRCPRLAFATFFQNFAGNGFFLCRITEKTFAVYDAA